MKNWKKPEFKEITLSMEVTAYSNTDTSRDASKVAAKPATRRTA